VAARRDLARELAASDEQRHIGREPGAVVAVQDVHSELKTVAQLVAPAGKVPLPAAAGRASAAGSHEAA
jgi:hypothetical protein